MTELNEKEREKAFKLWRIKLGMIPFDALLKPYLSEDILSYRTSQKSWLKVIRERLLLSRDSVASKTGVSRQTLEKYEKWEEKGSITITTLARVAEAMDCELVYAIRGEKVMPCCLSLIVT